MMRTTLYQYGVAAMFLRYLYEMISLQGQFCVVWRSTGTVVVMQVSHSTSHSSCLSGATGLTPTGSSESFCRTINRWSKLPLMKTHRCASTHAVPLYFRCSFTNARQSRMTYSRFIALWLTLNSDPVSLQTTWRRSCCATVEVTCRQTTASRNWTWAPWVAQPLNSSSTTSSNLEDSVILHVRHLCNRSIWSSLSRE